MAPTLAHYDDLESMEGIYNTEGYDYLAENPFREVALHPVSTLGADVDTASYANVRRFLNQGQLPPVGAVRIEEMLNYFHYDDPLPVSEHPLALCAELSTCPWNPTHQLLRLGLQTSPLDPGDLPPCNLVFLIDVSGSMAAPNKLPLVKSSMQRLVQSLGPRDRVAIAVYAGASGLVLDSTPADRITEILTTLDCLEAAGSTHGAAGLELAYRVAERAYLPGGNNRVILATDGDFNVGSTSRDALVRLIERKRQSGIFLSVLGFGQGNLKDSTMEQLAAHGNGNYAYIDSLSEARKVLVAEAGATLFTVARDVKLQLEWNPVQVRAYRLLGYENRVLAREDFADDTKDSAEIGAGHHVTVLYELIAGSVASGVETSRYWGSPQLSAAAHGGELGILKVRYKRPQSDDSRELTLTLDRSRVEHSEGATSDEFRLAAAVATFGLLLRDSKYRGEATYRLAEELAVSTLRGDHAGYRAQLLELIRTAQHLDDVTL
jgi:Ca-activated chloride channel family protein